MNQNELLSDELRLRVERLIKAKIVTYRQVGGGYTPALRLLCHTDQTSFFVKVGATPLTSTFLRREIRNYTTIRGDFMPQLVAYEDHESAPILITEDLAAYHWPPPWDAPQIERVLAQIATMHNTKVDLEPFVAVHGGRRANWATVAADPTPFLSLGLADASWLAVAIPLLIQAEAQCTTEGDSLTHWDLRSDNMCLTKTRVIFVDWNLACLSHPDLDLGFWLPSLAYEGGPLPDQILPHAPSVAAWVAGFFAARAGLPNIPDAPRVRLVQRQQLATALPWVVRALDLPPIR